MQMLLDMCNQVRTHEDLGGELHFRCADHLVDHCSPTEKFQELDIQSAKPGKASEKGLLAQGVRATNRNS